jgi:hypothetical protein
VSLAKDRRRKQEEDLNRTARHITLSNERGMVTELEMNGAASAANGQFTLRYHKTENVAAALLGAGSTDAASWTGFRYHDSQWSFVKFAAKPGTVVSFS